MNDSNNNGFDVNSVINGTPNGTAPQNPVNTTVGYQTSQPVPPVQGQNINSMNMNATPDPNAQINENLKRVQIDSNYKPPSKFKVFLLIVFFIFLIAFVIFLPDISSYINLYKAGKLNEVNEEITTGKLTCTLSSNTTNLDLDYVRVFIYTDKMLDRAEFTLTTRGDPTQDEATLDELNEKCQTLSTHVKSIDGVSVSCDYSDGKLVEKQAYTFANIDKEQLTAAFAEIGGTYPEFSAGQDIDSIEKTMLQGGYSCFKEK